MKPMLSILRKIKLAFHQFQPFWGFPNSSVGKSLPAMKEIQKTQVQPLGGEDPLEEGMQPTLVFLPRESHGQRSLAASMVAKSWTRLK